MPRFPIAPALLLAFLATAARAQTPAAAPPAFPVPPSRPPVDHHQHLISAPLAALWQPPAPAPLNLPADIAGLVAALEAGWNQQPVLAELYAANSMLIENADGDYLVGRAAVTTALANRFARAYRIEPVAIQADAESASIGAYLTRGEGATLNRFGYVLLSLQKAADGRWRVASQMLRFPGPPRLAPIDAEALIRLLDEAGIRRAVVLSTGYAFGSPLSPVAGDEPAAVRRENDWLAAQIASHSDRLFGTCGVNPLKDYAIAELDRCVGQLGLRGLKLHFANSGIDLRDPAHVARVQAIFREANRLRVPIIAHLWVPGPNYGRADAEIFLDQILPQAPNVVVQIAHMAGGGPGWNDDALGVYAEAVAARDPRTRNLYFDVATVADEQSLAQLNQLAARIRQIGPSRILYASDTAGPGRNPPRTEWANFRGTVPLSDEEFRVIAGNVAPYLR